MNNDLNVVLDAIHRRRNRNAALIAAFGLMALCLSLAFVLDDDLCIIASPFCALLCMYLSNQAQAWRDARIAVQLGKCQEAWLTVRLIPKGEHYEGCATVHVENQGSWEFADVGHVLPSHSPQSCRCYFRPGIEWPVLVTSDLIVIVPEFIPKRLDHNEQPEQKTNLVS